MQLDIECTDFKSRLLSKQYIYSDGKLGMMMWIHLSR